MGSRKEVRRLTSFYVELRGLLKFISCVSVSFLSESSRSQLLCIFYLTRVIGSFSHSFIHSPVVSVPSVGPVSLLN